MAYFLQEKKNKILIKYSKKWMYGDFYKKIITRKNKKKFFL